MENSIDELREKAEALGVEVDRRWSPGTLQEKIDEATHAAEMEQASVDSARAAAEYENYALIVGSFAGDPKICDRNLFPIMRPHPNNLNSMFLNINLIDKAMLNINSTRITSLQISC